MSKGNFNWRKFLGWFLIINFLPLAAIVVNFFPQDAKGSVPIWQAYLTGHILNFVLILLFGFIHLVTNLINHE